MRMLFRLLSMLKLDVVYTQGFNPHPKVSLSPPLPLGVIGTCEYFDISFRSSFSPEEIVAAFGEFGIPDFSVYEALPAALSSGIPSYEIIQIDVSSLPGLDIDRLILEFFQRSEFIFTKIKKDKVKTYDLRKIIEELSFDGSKLMIRKSLQSPALYDVLEQLLHISRDRLYNLEASRISLFTKPESDN
jgi:radical SAM-linked protein